MRSTGGSGGGRGAMVTSIATGTAGATSVTGYSRAGSVSGVLQAGRSAVSDHDAWRSDWHCRRSDVV